MLHTIAAGTRDVYQQQVAYAAKAHLAGFIYQPGAICGLDRERKEIEVAALTHLDGRMLLARRRIPYDVLIMAIGSRANDFVTPGVQERCYIIDSRIHGFWKGALVWLVDRLNHRMRPGIRLD